MKKLQDDDGGVEYLQYKAVGQVAEMSSLSIGMDNMILHITMRTGLRFALVSEDEARSEEDLISFLL